MKFIKDIIGEQRDRLSPEAAPQPIPEDRSAPATPLPDPVQDSVQDSVQDIDTGALSFLRLDPADRVQNATSLSDKTAQALNNLDAISADAIGTPDTIEFGQAERAPSAPAEPSAPTEAVLESSDIATLDQMVQDSVAAQSAELVPPPETSVPAPEHAPEPADMAGEGPDIAAAPKPDLGPDPFASLGAELRQTPAPSPLEMAEPAKRIFRRRKLSDATAAAPVADAAPHPIDVPPPMPGRSADFTSPAAPSSAEAPAQPSNAAATRPARAGRVKTRLLGFGHQQDPLATSAEAPAAEMTRCPVGWIAVVDGPGRGATFALGNGVSTIGRGAGQSLQLDFGDTSISRENHASLAYDPETRGFYLGHGGKANLVRLNGKPVLSTETLRNGDEIRLGETRLRFVALCGESFDWGDDSPAQSDAQATAFQTQGDGFSHALSR
ncbi:hypothetical protein TRM7557_00351 [Tritonibacter multivorans]|uniref:FHA domain-containing protein n=1 Tax=Tritonibacter multivorans TaxID=928856 RepID=A0A0P1G0V3_9RHOB|nr:FHA domain-containing protein [Tritonibacter multivorans]MDA7419389.1 FHA domain-containing protein [Tritonibacter multivorans]CUH75367.1 hypothetical protein TRM7557_00351 [Tritonibacter multivorans]SFD20621.1 FHA domain-containing protein [Tritonibacter multivorans]